MTFKLLSAYTGKTSGTIRVAPKELGILLGKLNKEDFETAMEGMMSEYIFRTVEQKMERREVLEKLIKTGEDSNE